MSSKEVVKTNHISSATQFIQLRPTKRPTASYFSKAEGSAGKAIVIKIRYRSREALELLGIILEDLGATPAALENGVATKTSPATVGKKRTFPLVELSDDKGPPPRKAKQGEGTGNPHSRRLGQSAQRDDTPSNTQRTKLSLEQKQCGPSEAPSTTTATEMPPATLVEPQPAGYSNSKLSNTAPQPQPTPIPNEKEKPLDDDDVQIMDSHAAALSTPITRPTAMVKKEDDNDENQIVDSRPETRPRPAVQATAPTVVAQGGNRADREREKAMIKLRLEELKLERRLLELED